MDQVQLFLVVEEEVELMDYHLEELVVQEGVQLVLPQIVQDLQQQ